MTESASSTFGVWWRHRVWILIACAVSVAACLGYAALRSSMPVGWLRSNGGGVPYVVFWILLSAIVWSQKKNALPIAVAATLVTCGLEFFQLYNPEPLAAFRRTSFGAALLGSSFAWADIPPYFIGGAIGWAIALRLGRDEAR